MVRMNTCHVLVMCPCTSGTYLLLHSLQENSLGEMHYVDRIAPGLEIRALLLVIKKLITYLCFTDLSYDCSEVFTCPYVDMLCVLCLPLYGYIVATGLTSQNLESVYKSNVVCKSWRLSNC